MTKNYYKRSSCRICGSADLHCFLDLGSTPPSDAFISEDQLKRGDELSFPLSVHVCKQCNHIQLLDVVNPRLLFPKEYALFSSAAPAGVRHFNDYATDIKEKFGSINNNLVIEIASNDGVLLVPLKELGFQVLGVEPTTNTADVARSRGIEVVEEFFSEDESENIKEKYGRAGIIIANNVLAHVDEPIDFVKGVKNLLDEDGVFVFEVQYGLDLIKKTEFDNIYHEHLSFFALRPLSILMEKCGMKIFDIKKVSAQGGSLRCYAAHRENGAYSIEKIVEEMCETEVREGLGAVQTYDDFGRRAHEIRTGLLAIINDAKKNGKRIVGYGAPAKGNTLLNFCGIGPALVDYCIEKTPFKFNKFTPGMHIPVVSDEIVKRDGPPDFYLLLIWNYLDSVLEREKEYIERGGSFIVPIPQPRIVR
jgi:SAM-dependent methyltransferase